MNAIDVEVRFFRALLGVDLATLDDVLTEDFVLVALNGGQMTKAELLTLVESRQLQFLKIDRLEATVRVHGATSVITGRTEMQGSFAGTPFTAQSRYTHVFIKDEKWRMMSAQGTPIADSSL